MKKLNISNVDNSTAKWKDLQKVGRSDLMKNTSQKNSLWITTKFLNLSEERRKTYGKKMNIHNTTKENTCEDQRS